jgi:multidrug efflux pump
MRQTLGIAVFSGMLGVTAFGIFFTPVFYAVIRRFTETKTEVPPQALSDSENGAVLAADAKVDGHPAKSERSAQAVY